MVKTFALSFVKVNSPVIIQFNCVPICALALIGFYFIFKLFFLCAIVSHMIDAESVVKKLFSKDIKVYVRII